MNFSDNGRISSNQLRSIISVSLLGTLSVSLPLGIIEKSGAAAYISIAVGGIIVSLIFYIFTFLVFKIMKEGFEHTALNVLGKPLGTVYVMIVYIHISVFCGFQLSGVCNMINSLTDKSLGFNIPGICILISAFYMAGKGIECIGRTAEIVFVLMIIFIAFIFVMNVRDMDIDILMPVPEERDTIPVSIMQVISSFGIISYVFLLVPYTVKGDNKKTAFSVFCAFIIITAVISLGTALAVSCFGIDEAIRKIYPLIQMMNYTEFPASLLERQEVLMSGFYIFSVFLLTGSGIYILASILDSLFSGRRKRLYTSTALLSVAVCAAFSSGNAFSAVNDILCFNIIMYFIMPAVPLAALIKRRMRREK